MIATIWKGCVKSLRHDGKRVLLVRLAGAKRVSYKLLYKDELYRKTGRRQKAA